jgi:hypothetical protein
MTGTSAARQTLVMESSGAFGVEGGIRLFMTRHVGLELAGGRTWASLSGENTPYAVALDYISRQPPDYTPKPMHYARAIDWADTEGDRRVTTIVAGPVIRWLPRTGPVSGTFSGGLSFQRIDGPVTSLGYTEFRMGGHSTLFSSQHRIEVETGDDAWIVGPYLAGDVRIRVTGRVGLTAGLRVHLSGEPDPRQTRVVGLVDPDEDPFVPNLAAVEAALEPGSETRHAAARWQVFAGLTIGIL